MSEGQNYLRTSLAYGCVKRLSKLCDARLSDASVGCLLQRPGISSSVVNEETTPSVIKELN
jgi:hypothetical protein